MRIVPSVANVNDVLREELWIGRTGADVSAFLEAAGMKVDQTKVSGWKRDRAPSLEQMAEIEQAHGLPRGWILWRAGYIDAEALVARGDTPPPAISVETLSPVEVAKQLAELRAGLLAITKQLKGR